MSRLVLITGGAGFIGSHLADELLSRGYRVRVLDNLEPQVHGPDRKRPAYLHPDVALQVGDVRDLAAVHRALEGVDAVFHFAARVGVGQSAYEMAEYTATNVVGTAILLEAISRRPVGRLLVASSMSLYGEGLYRAPDGSLRGNAERTEKQLRQGDWEVRDLEGQTLQPVPTPETKTPALSSVYALTKFDQERLCLLAGQAYKVPTTALRFFNVYGTRQALSNPYTGVLAIFAARLLNGHAPMVFEDGRQRRDFVHVRDVARACRLALESDATAGEALNIASGRSATVLEVARRLGEVLDRRDVSPEITGKYRVGDIRNCFADIGRAKRLMGYQPAVTLEDGLAELSAWLREQAAVDRVAEARAELDSRGLTF